MPKTLKKNTIKKKQEETYVDFFLLFYLYYLNFYY